MGPFTSANVGVNCPPTSGPIRCSWSAQTGNTGLAFGDTSPCNWNWGCFCNVDCNNNTENEYGNSFVSALNVSAGQIYIILVDNYSNSGQPYTMSFGGTAGLGCIPVNLPVELIDFDGYNDGVDNVLCWKTASEKDNDYFILEQSYNGVDWNYVGVSNGAGTSTETLKYEYKHSKYRDTTNYYRLSQVDFNGDKKIFDIIAINNSTGNKEVFKTINLLGQDVDENEKGMLIEIYTDGTSRKIFKN